MSPEQAEGKPVDARSDIFSFGAMLYEMATGRKGLPRRSAISEDHRDPARRGPEPPRKIVNRFPRELERIIFRCLRKYPAPPSPDIDDLKVALEELKDESESGMLRTAAAPDVPQTKPRAHRRSIWLAAGVALIMIAALAAVWLLRRCLPPPLIPSSTPTTSTTDPGHRRLPDLLAQRRPDRIHVEWTQPGQLRYLRQGCRRRRRHCG